MRAMILTAAAAAAILVPAAAEARKKQPPPAPAPVAAPQIALPSSPNGLTVRYYYVRRDYAPIWFRAGAGEEAIGQLVSILRRAPIDGMANGPQIAASIEAAVAAARTGDAIKQKEAELALSAAWVDYVQTLQRPTSNVVWGDPALVLRPSHPDRILALLSAAPSLASHLQAVSAVNPIYGKLREVAVAEAAANGGRASDRVMLNLERSRIIPATGKFLLVNSAEQRLRMYENGQDVGSMKVVVGDKATLGLPTPIVASTMYYAIANPYWHVPPHLIRKMAPNIAKAPEAYLKSRGYDVISEFGKNATVLPPSSVDWKAVAAGTQKVILRQRPNGDNSMGRMKFPFPNREGIFLHDTPKKEYFALENRAKSNGCIRVEDYRRLANWLFGGRDVAAVGSDPEQHIQMPRGVPVYVTYLTMVPDAAGIVSFADRYGWDRPGVLAGGMDVTVGTPAAGRESVSAGGSGAGTVN